MSFSSCFATFRLAWRWMCSGSKEANNFQQSGRSCRCIKFYHTFFETCV